MKLYNPVSGMTPDDLQMYPAHWINEEWEHFASNHHRWLTNLQSPSLLYSLPTNVIDGLERSKNRRPLVPNARAFAAERELAKICKTAGAVGFSQGRFIHYPLLLPPAAVSNHSLTPERSRLWPVGTLDKGVLERLKGYAGRLVTDSLFLAQAEGLRKRWYDWPETQRPILPLARLICANHYPGLSHTGTSRQKAFEADFQAFCDKWLLAGMATWDLPVPRGPLLPGERRTTVEILPAGMLTLVVPFFYPLLGDDSILGAIYKHQKEATREKGLDEDLAGLSHYKTYGQMLTVAHIERVLMDRYWGGKPTWGLVGQLEEALQVALSSGTDQIKKLRKAISACRRGKRVRLTWLTPRRR